MASEIIDLDTYEFCNDIINLDSRETAANDYLADYRIFDAEIIDYGICEDQHEDCNVVSPKANITSPLPEKTQYKLPLSPHKTPNIHKTKGVSVKVVDCNIYPWYYTKYRNQIIEQQYLNAIDHARNILNVLKSSINEKKNDDDVHKIQFKSSKKVHKTNTETKIISTTVDLKKNIGLVGMKVQKLDGDKYKDYCINKKKMFKAMVKKPKIKTNENSENDAKTSLCKPMPMSKKLALQNQINEDVSLHSSNKKTEQLRTYMKNPTTILITKHGTTNTTSTQQKNDKTIYKSFITANKFTEKVLKSAKKNVQKDTKLNKDETKKIIINEEKKTSKLNLLSKPSEKMHIKKVNVKYDSIASSQNSRDVKIKAHTKPTVTSIFTKPDNIKPHIDPVLLNKNINSSKSYHKNQAAMNEHQKNTTSALINNNITKTINNSTTTTVTNGARTPIKNITKIDTELYRKDNSNFVPRFQAQLTTSTSNQTTSAISVNKDLIKSAPKDKVKESETGINLTDADKIHVHDNKTIKLIAPSITSLSQEPPMPQEYIVPDLIRSSTQSPVNCQKSLSIAIPDSVPRSQLPPAYGQYANTIQNVNSNIPIENKIERNLQSIAKTYQIPVLNRAPPNPNVVTRPNIIRKANVLTPFWDAQQPIQMMTSESAVQPVQQHSWQYSQPNYAYPQTDLHRMSWNMQRVGVNPNYPSQPIYTRENIPTIQYPPGTSNVHPNSYHIGSYNYFNPAYPTTTLQAPQLYPHQYASNGNNSSIIGENTTGLVKKINITSTPVTTPPLKKQKKESTIKKVTKISVDNLPAVSTKSEMMEELQKALLSDIDDLVDTDPKGNETTNKTESYNFATQKPLTEQHVIIPKQQTNNTDVYFINQPPKHNNTILHRNSSKLANPIEPLTNNINAAFKRHTSDNMNKESDKYLNRDKPEDTNNYNITKPGPLPKKLKPNETPTASTHQVPVKRYSPPILPIPTYQNILSQIQTVPSKDRFGKPTFSKTKKINKNIIQNSPNKMNKATKYSKDKEASKKISLEEYKKRVIGINGNKQQ